MMKLWLSIPLLILLAGCAGGPTPIPDPDSAAAQLYTDKCSACHALPHPKRHTLAEWQSTFTLMEQRIAERGLPAISADEKQILLGYLKEHAR
jgi:cytochrome c5